jgi:nucleoside-diphosphate-sugar epimerase
LLPRLAGAARLVALGSTSAAVKADSPHAADRRIAQALDDAEAAIRAGAGEAGPAWTILRPTLVYDCRTDGTVTAAAHVIDRFGVFPIPGGAGGRRQPVHADDVAAAMLAALAAPAAYNRAFDLPGGETLAWRTMLARIAEALGRPVRLLPVPLPLLTAGLWAARRAGRDLSPSLFARMTVDQLFDAGPARSAFGYDPGPFRPVFPWARRTARNPPSHARP